MSTRTTPLKATRLLGDFGDSVNYQASQLLQSARPDLRFLCAGFCSKPRRAKTNQADHTNLCGPQLTFYKGRYAFHLAQLVCLSGREPCSLELSTFYFRSPIQPRADGGGSSCPSCVSSRRQSLSDEQNQQTCVIQGQLE